MGTHFVGGVSKSILLTKALDNNTNALDDLHGGDAEEFLCTRLHVCACNSGDQRQSVQSN